LLKKRSYHVVYEILLHTNIVQLTHQFVCLNYSLQKHDSSNIISHGIPARFAAKQPKHYFNFQCITLVICITWIFSYFKVRHPLCVIDYIYISFSK